MSSTPPQADSPQAVSATHWMQARQSRRDFLRTASVTALVAAGCSTPTETLLERARLSARPGTPSSALGPGAHPLNLGWARDGFIYVPPTYEPATPAPLLVLLHGGGVSSKEWSGGVLPSLVDDLGIVVLCPDSRARTWDVVNSGEMGVDVEFIDRALRWTFSRINVDEARMALGGFSDGGSYALSLGITNGDLFSALLGFSPGVVLAATRVGSPRVFMTHGTNDGTIPVQNSRTISEELEQAGFDVTYTEFVGGHTLTGALMRQGLEWFVPAA